MTIDWKTAPEGATHYCKNTNTFFKLSNDRGFFWIGCWAATQYTLTTATDNSGDFTPRPTSAATQTPEAEQLALRTQAVADAEIESDKAKDARIASLQARYLQAINLMGAAVFDRGQSAQMLADMVDFFSNTPLDPGGLKNAMTGCDLLRNAKAIIKKVDADLEHNAEFERIQTGHRRYETLRTLNVPQFRDLYIKSLESGLSFDELVDAIGKEGC